MALEVTHTANGLHQNAGNQEFFFFGNDVEVGDGVSIWEASDLGMTPLWEGTVTHVNPNNANPRACKAIVTWQGHGTWGSGLEDVSMTITHGGTAVDYKDFNIIIDPQ